MWSEGDLDHISTAAVILQASLSHFHKIHHLSLVIGEWQRETEASLQGALC